MKLSLGLLVVRPLAPNPLPSLSPPSLPLTKKLERNCKSRRRNRRSVNLYLPPSLPLFPTIVLLALSSSHPDPLGALSSLWDLTSKEKLFNSNSYPTNLGGVGGGEGDGRNNWVNPDVLRFIVLVHDFGEGGGRDGWEE